MVWWLCAYSVARDVTCFIPHNRCSANGTGHPIYFTPRVPNFIGEFRLIIHSQSEPGQFIEPYGDYTLWHFFREGDSIPKIWHILATYCNFCSRIF